MTSLTPHSTSPTLLREQIDLATLERDLGVVVAETMQPAHASVWLRGEPR